MNELERHLFPPSVPKPEVNKRRGASSKNVVQLTRTDKRQSSIHRLAVGRDPTRHGWHGDWYFCISGARREVHFNKGRPPVYKLLKKYIYIYSAVSRIFLSNCVVNLVKVYFTQRTTQRCCLLSALLPGSVATWFNYFQSGRMFISLPFLLNDCPLFIRKPIQFHPQPQLKKTNQKKNSNMFK